MVYAILSLTIMLLSVSTLLYRQMFHTELDKRLKHEVKVKNLILEHNRVADEITGNAYRR